MQVHKSDTPSIFEFPSIGSSIEGYISIAEIEKNVPFKIERVYWTYFTPQNVMRGFHAHKELYQIIIAVCGKIVFTVEDRFGKRNDFTLDQPHTALYLPPLTWREIRFSHNAVLVCLASEQYIETDYIREYSKFRDEIGMQEIQ